MFKIAIFSDIHGNLEALEAILCSVEKEDFDEIVCLGDIIGLGPSPKECLDLIIENKIKIVLGNHERYYLNGTHNEQKMSLEEKAHHDWVNKILGNEYKDYLSKLDIELSVTMNDKKIGFMHYPFDKISDDFYKPRDLEEETVKRMFRNYTYNFTFFGHSHKEQFYKDENENIFINVGSSGCGVDNITTYTILEYDGENYKIYKKKCIYDRMTFDKKMNEINYPEKNNIRRIFF